MKQETYVIKADARLFPTGLPSGEWTEFAAKGFARPVWGVIYRKNCLATCGMPLGAIDTGCLDLEGDGTFGFCTIFNSHVPRRGPLNLPFLGIHVDDRTWILTTRRMKSMDMPGQYGRAAPDQVSFAEEIHYWGHYPVVDLEYQTRAPVGVSLRAWVPFVPGDVEASNIPAAVFEVHLRNLADEAKEGVVGFSFPGPNEAEAGSFPMRRRFVHKEACGLVGFEVAGERSGYVLGVIGEEEITSGGELGMDAGAWRRIGKGLPFASGQPGSSVSVKFSLQPGEEKIVRFILAWYSPQWYAGGTPDPTSKFTLPWYEHELKKGHPQDGRGSAYTHMYSARFGNAVEVAELVAKEHESLLRRVVAWQEVIYTEESLPGWLRDSLVNILHLITETSFWAMARPPIGEWCHPDDGLFGMNEDPRNCPQIECLPCSFVGNYPVVLFFPQLALSTLRGYKAYQFENGEVTWIFGGMTDKPPSPPCEMATPTRGYQTTLNGPCVVDMVYRYWLRTGNEEALKEFYDCVKRSTTFTMNLRPEDGPDGIISFPTGNVGLEWFEACTWAGMAAHVGGIHLANLKQAEAMAEKVGDTEFVEQCREWFRQGSGSMENKMWTGEYYLNYWEPATGRKSDFIMANQLDGEWMMRVAGLPNVFRPDRIKKTLAAVKRTCVTATPYGAVNFTDPDGRPTTSGEGSLAGIPAGWNYNRYAFFPPEVLVLGMLYMYEGEQEFGLELCRRCWANIVQHGLTWDQPNIIRGDTGERVYGGDYYQNMMLWIVPAACAGQDIQAFSAPSALVDRIIAAGKKR
jgi:non-lysosomal glucosylceramidase